MSRLKQKNHIIKQKLLQFAQRAKDEEYSPILRIDSKPIADIWLSPTRVISHPQEFY